MSLTFSVIRRAHRSEFGQGRIWFWSVNMNSYSMKDCFRVADMRQQRNKSTFKVFKLLTIKPFKAIHLTLSARAWTWYREYPSPEGRWRQPVQDLSCLESLTLKRLPLQTCIQTCLSTGIQPAFNQFLPILMHDEGWTSKTQWSFNLPAKHTTLPFVRLLFRFRCIHRRSWAYR